MGISGAVFESAGKRTVHWVPGVYSRRNTVPSGQGTISSNLVIMGQSTGGKPNSLIPVSDVNEAKQLLTGGQLLDAVAHAFNGSDDFVPQVVYAWRVNKGTRSSITLKSGNTDILAVKSKDYGVHTNQLKIWVQDGTAANSKKILLSFKGNDIVQDNILRKSFSVRYSGSSGTAATATVTATGISFSVTGDSDADLNITWDECETLEDLAARLNDSGFYVATLLDERANIKTANLDTTSEVSVYGAAATFYSNLAAFCEALSAMQYIGEVEIVSADIFVTPDSGSSFSYFGGAVAGTYTVADWQDSLELLEEEDVQSIATPSTDHDVRILISNHITSMNQTEKRKERMGICGLPAGADAEAAIAAAAELSEYMSLVMDTAVANDPLTGATKTIDPALLACKIAGAEAAMGMSNPLTNKPLKVNSFGAKRRVSELNALIQGGVMPCGISEEGSLVVIRAMTCYQGDNLALNERSCVREALYMDRDLRKAFSRRTGTATEPSRSEIVATLLRKAEQWYTLGYITRSDSGELAFDIKVRFDGDKTYLEYSKYIRAPNNFTFITTNNMIYSSAAA